MARLNKINIQEFSNPLKNNFENKTLWLTFALSQESPRSACQAFNECLRIDQFDPVPAMLAAKIMLQQLNDPLQGLQLAEQAIARCQLSQSKLDECNNKNMEPILSKSYLLASLMHAYIYEREPESIRQFKTANLQSSLHYLDLAFKTYPNDYLVYFHKALHEAKQRSYSSAIDNIQKAIKLNPHHVPSIQLLILSLSALKLYNEALVLCESTLHEFEDNLLLLYIKCNLEQCLIETKGYKMALNTAQHILKCIRRNSSKGSISSGSIKSQASEIKAQLLQPRTPSIQQSQQSLQKDQQPQTNHTNHNQHQQLQQQIQPQHQQPQQQQQPAHQQAPNNNSNIATITTIVTPDNTTPKQGTNLFAENNNNNTMTNNSPEKILAGVQLFTNGELTAWLLVAEIFIKLGSMKDAELCVDEGSIHANGALSYQLMYVRGLIAKAKNNLIEAKSFFQSCLALQPRHAYALQQIAHVHHLLGNHSTAEKFLKDSLDIYSDCHKTWYYLSLVFIETNQHDKASECLKKVNLLEETSPVIDISTISRLTLE